MYEENEVQVKNDCTSVRISGNTWFGIVKAGTQLTDKHIIEKE